MKPLLILALLTTPAIAQDTSALLKVGEDHMQQNDITGARLALSVARIQGDARATWLLANTYDPFWLEKHTPTQDDVRRFSDRKTAAELYAAALR